MVGIGMLKEFKIETVTAHGGQTLFHAARGKKPATERFGSSGHLYKCFKVLWLVKGFGV